ncbi:MAG: creatininase family protein [Lachnospiraceae bacterium]
MSKWQIPAKGGHMEAADGVYYQNMTNKDVAERLKKNDVILIPVGSTENHGPNAPYGEDTYLDTRLCEQVALALAVRLHSLYGMARIRIIILECRERS